MAETTPHLVDVSNMTTIERLNSVRKMPSNGDNLLDSSANRGISGDNRSEVSTVIVGGSSIHNGS